MSAITRGSTRNSIGEMPIVVSASISCVTFIVPSCAAKAAPVRPAMMIAVIIAPMSRAIADADQVGDRDRRAELLELHGAHEGENHADQETDQRDDAERVGAAILDRDHQINPPVARTAGHEPAKRDRHRAEERKEVANRLGVGDGRGTYAFDQRTAGEVGRASLVSGTVSASSTSRRSPPGRPAGSTVAARATEFEHFRDEGDQAAIPLSQARRVECDPPWNRRPHEFALHRHARGKSSLKMPIAGQTSIRVSIRSTPERKL